MLKFLKKRKKRKAKKRAEEWREVKKAVFVNRLKNGKPHSKPRRGLIMKVKGNYDLRKM